jgi:hypothetical protein
VNALPVIPAKSDGSGGVGVAFDDGHLEVAGFGGLQAVQRRSPMISSSRHLAFVAAVQLCHVVI